MQWYHVNPDLKKPSGAVAKRMAAPLDDGCELRVIFSHDETEEGLQFHVAVSVGVKGEKASKRRATDGEMYAVRELLKTAKHKLRGIDWQEGTARKDPLVRHLWETKLARLVR